MPTDGFVLLADPQIAAVPVAECGQPLRSVDDSSLALDPRKRDPLGLHALVRDTVLARLVAVQARLPEGVRLLVVEAYRPVELQLRYFNEHSARLQRAHPDWAAAQVRREASAYVSPVEVAPHCTGAAVDVTLCTANGELDLGTAMNVTPEDSAGGCYTASDAVRGAAAVNRRTLIAAMSAEGFVNYPTEWWHWSYGDRYWAHASRAEAAIYGPCRPEDFLAEP